MGEPRVARPHLALSLGAPSTTGQRPRSGGSALGSHPVVRAIGLLLLLQQQLLLLLRRVGLLLRGPAPMAATAAPPGGVGHGGGPSARGGTDGRLRLGGRLHDALPKSSPLRHAVAKGGV